MTDAVIAAMNAPTMAAWTQRESVLLTSTTKTVVSATEVAEKIHLEAIPLLLV